jgi:hypothetical protein
MKEGEAVAKKAKRVVEFIIKAHADSVLKTYL